MSAPTDIRGLVLRDSLSELEPVLKYWQVLNENWGISDAPWWYNERASISFLAGAIWKYGAWLLEEFSTDKLVGQRENKKVVGRCDIAFGIDGQDYWGEAKQCWPALNGKNNNSMITLNLDRAEKQVKSGKERGYKGLAIAFVVPKVLRAGRRQIDTYILNYIDQLKTIPNATLAWIFPAQTRNLYPNNDWRDYYFPGIILALRPVK